MIDLLILNLIQKNLVDTLIVLLLKKSLSIVILNYINNILLTHTDEIIKKDDEIEGKIILQLYENIMKENNHKFLS